MGQLGSLTMSGKILPFKYLLPAAFLVKVIILHPHSNWFGLIV